jgi:hypothetical protein
MPPLPPTSMEWMISEGPRAPLAGDGPFRKHRQNCSCAPTITNPPVLRHYDQTSSGKSRIGGAYAPAITHYVQENRPANTF